jgi:hypothetical protein
MKIIDPNTPSSSAGLAEQPRPNRHLSAILRSASVVVAYFVLSQILDRVSIVFETLPAISPWYPLTKSNPNNKK